VVRVHAVALSMARAGQAAQAASQRAFSAGGIVIRPAEHGREVLLGRRRRDRDRVAWSLPKGTPADGETPAQTALREVREETGIEVRIIGDIGDIHYRFVRDGRRIDKTVRYFLMEATGGDLADHDHEFEEVRWFALGEAEALMTFPTERRILARALPVAEGDRG
jgi:8-oxo-dGTP pyrophosphatase MutT (NUDIX family)